MSATNESQSVSMGPVVWVLVAVLSLAAAGGWWSHRAVAKAQQSYDRARFRLNRVNALPYMPEEGGPALLAERKEQLQRMLDDRSRSLADVWTRMAGATPGDATALYFHLAALVDEQRKAGVAAGVELKPDERFGFDEFARQGPDERLLSDVYAQAVVQERLLTLLWEARPSALTGVMREWVYEKSDDALDADPWSEPVREVVMPKLEDIFKADETEASLPKGTMGVEFRYVFEGYSSSLRDWLNALQEEALPIRVLSLEVEPLAANGAKRQGEQSDEPSVESLKENPFLAFQEAEQAEEGDTDSVPIIEENLSRFSVSLECVIPVRDEGGAL